MGIQPTGKQVTVSGLTISRREDGKIVEEFQNWDTFGMLQQLGAVPEMANAYPTSGLVEGRPGAALLSSGTPTFPMAASDAVGTVQSQRAAAC
jgi:hypothetical protein